MDNIKFIKKTSYFINEIKHSEKLLIIYRKTYKLFSEHIDKILKVSKNTENLDKRCDVCEICNLQITDENLKNCLTNIILTITGMIFLFNDDKYVFERCNPKETSKIGVLISEDWSINNTIIKKGTFMVLGEQFNEIKLPNNSIVCHNINNFKILNSKIIFRLSYIKKINYIFEQYKKEEDWKQCFVDIMEDPNSVIGIGGFGIVKKIKKNINDIFILKSSFVDAEETPVNECFVLKYICNDIINKKLCPNVPYTFENFSCDNCSFETLNNKYKNVYCISNCSEFANYNLRGYLEKINNPSKELLNSLLFQIMAGLHTLQHHYQTCHFDIKAPNILIYNVTPGGFWKYTIYGKDYYVPNYGAVAIINDFGLAKYHGTEYPINQYSNISYIDIGYKCNPIMTKRFTSYFGTKFAKLENNKLIPFTYENNEKGRIIPVFNSVVNSTTIQTEKLIQFYCNNTVNFNSVANNSDYDVSQFYPYTFSYTCEKYTQILNEFNSNIDFEPYTDEFFLQKIKNKLNVEKKIIDSKTISFLKDPNYPILEFYGDTQDVIRMFLSNGIVDMTYQMTFHEKIITNEEFKTDLKHYFWDVKTIESFEKTNISYYDGIPQEYPLLPELMFAGSFIDSYFKDIFTDKKPDILEEYKIS